MKRKLQISYILAIIGFVFTYLFSSANNPAGTALIRSFLCFAIFFVAGIILTSLLEKIIETNPTASDAPVHEESVGQHVDLSTPDDLMVPGEELDPSATDEEQAFEPLQFPQFKTKEERSPEEMAKAIRHLSDQ